MAAPVASSDGWPSCVHAPALLSYACRSKASSASRSLGCSAPCRAVRARTDATVDATSAAGVPSDSRYCRAAVALRKRPRIGAKSGRRLRAHSRAQRSVACKLGGACCELRHPPVARSCASKATSASRCIVAGASTNSPISAPGQDASSARVSAHPAAAARLTGAEPVFRLPWADALRSSNPRCEYASSPAAPATRSSSTSSRFLRICARCRAPRRMAAVPG